MQVCAEAGRHGDLIAHKSERSGKRFIRCTNYDECGVSYPLPARGKLTATGRDVPRVRRPHDHRGDGPRPWKKCVNMDCPTNERKTPARGRAAAGKASGAKKAATKKATTKKSAAKKTTAKRSSSKKNSSEVGE